MSARLGLRLWLVWIVVAFFAVIGYGIADDLGLLEDPTPPSGYATADIPPPYLAWYRRAAEGCPGLSWTVLAAVGKHESDHGRTDLPGVRSGANRAGAAGPMQLGIRGRAGQTWQRYRVDADHDGHISVYDPPDAITAAAAKLCADGAGRQGGLWGALYAYNPSGRYVDRVLRTARRYTGQPSPGPGGGQRPCGGPSAMTLASYRCVPRRGRSRPQPVPLLVSGPPPAGFVQAGLDAYRHTGTRPPWLSEELLRILERRDRLIGVVYLLHFDQLIGDLANPRGFALHYTGRAASSGLLKVLRRADGAEFAELPWVNRMGPPGAPGTPPAPRHRLRVVGGCVLGVVVGTAVLLGTVAAGAVVVGTPTGAVVVDAGPDGDVVDVAGARVAGGIDRSAPATTTPTEVLPPCRGWVPNKLASGWLATVSTPVIATTAIPKASTAATATRCQRIGWGCASLAPSSLGPACSPTRRTSERRATRWADASEWVYTASAGATSRLTSAAPMRVPSTPNKDATTAPLTAASAPASNLGMRSCSIPHLEGRGGDGGAAVWGPRARPDWNPAAARVPTLATQAGSRQRPPGQAGDRAAWGSCGLGDRSFKAALVGRAELQAAHGPRGPEVVHDHAHVGPPPVHQSQRADTVSDSRAEILLINQKSCGSMRACRARWLSRDNARAAVSNARTNSRQIQHWTLDLPLRLKEHAAGRGARLMEVVADAGIGWQLARVWAGDRARERSLKRSGGAARCCPVCQLARPRPGTTSPHQRPAGPEARRSRRHLDHLAAADAAGGSRMNHHDHGRSYPMTPQPSACWIDRDYDRTYTSNRHGRYAAYLVDHADLFNPWQDAPGGITGDPVQFAIAAFLVATGPIMSPGYVRWHSPVHGHHAARGEDDGRLVLSVTLAVPTPIRLPWSWRGWERDRHDRYLEPDDRRPVGLTRLELRWPVATDQLPVPAPPKLHGVPNPADAARAVEVLVDQVNTTARPVLAKLEGRG